MNLEQEREDRFWNSVSIPKDVMTGCWLWTAGKNQFGYGYFRITPKIHARVHRVAYVLVKGPIPQGMVLDHLCRVRHCVNPNHLEAVTVGENVRRGLRDRDPHDRRGDLSRYHKVSEADVHTIRADYKAGLSNINQLATKYGLHRDTVKGIISRKSKSWVWLKSPDEP